MEPEIKLKLIEMAMNMAAEGPEKTSIEERLKRFDECYAHLIKTVAETVAKSPAPETRISRRT